MTIEKAPVHANASETVPTLSRLGDHDMTVSSSDEDIRGRTVKDKDGQDIGKIDGLLVDDVEQKVRFMEVATGGFLGFGESTTLIPIEAITRITAEEVHISHTREHVAGAPRSANRMDVDVPSTVDTCEAAPSGNSGVANHHVWAALAAPAPQDEPCRREHRHDHGEHHGDHGEVVACDLAEHGDCEHGAMPPWGRGPRGSGPSQRCCRLAPGWTPPGGSTPA